MQDGDGWSRMVEKDDGDLCLRMVQDEDGWLRMMEQDGD